MNIIKEAYDWARSVFGQVLGVVGEARRLLELRNTLSKEEYTYLEGQCPQYGGSMIYLLILDILKSYSVMKEEDS